MEKSDRKGGKEAILCMYSGGIDSTGVLHQLMTDEKYNNYILLVHHIHIVNRENRALAESNAVSSILSYYKKNSQRDFLVTESTFNTAGFAPLRSHRFPFDMDICAFLSGNICAARKEIKYVAMGRTKTDVESGGENFMSRMERAQSIFKSVLSLENGDVPEYIFPVVQYTKEEIWNFLPKTVRNSTWWCRRPEYTPGKEAKACGKCQTCKDVKNFAHADV